MVKKGDTLVEVALAIGIFSMVAIAVVAVMVSGTSNAQNALETTLAREEIDTQAEALRFIHSAYLADEDVNKGPYVKLWERITKKAIQTNTEAYRASVTEYSTLSCRDIYDNPNIMNSAFIINPRILYRNPEAAFIEYSPTAPNGNKFYQTQTHPRLMYQLSGADTLLNENAGETLSRAEGIFIIATADSNNTPPTFYDFYIRTCWYGTGSDSPSAISTVIRLYNPKGIAK